MSYKIVVKRANAYLLLIATLANVLIAAVSTWLSITQVITRNNLNLLNSFDNTCNKSQKTDASTSKDATAFGQFFPPLFI